MMSRVKRFKMELFGEKPMPMKTGFVAENIHFEQRVK